MGAELLLLWVLWVIPVNWPAVLPSFSYPFSAHILEAKRVCNGISHHLGTPRTIHTYHYLQLPKSVYKSINVIKHLISHKESITLVGVLDGKIIVNPHDTMPFRENLDLNDIKSYMVSKKITGCIITVDTQHNNQLVRHLKIDISIGVIFFWKILSKAAQLVLQRNNIIGLCWLVGAGGRHVGTQYYRKTHNCSGWKTFILWAVLFIHSILERSLVPAIHGIWKGLEVQGMIPGQGKGIKYYNSKSRAQIRSLGLSGAPSVNEMLYNAKTPD